MAALPSDDPLDPKRRRRVDFTLPEILEQPEVIRTTLGHVFPWSVLNAR